jgi:hypothetical protein
MKEYYTQFAYERFNNKKRKYIFGSYSKFYKKKINFKNALVIDYGCGNFTSSGIYSHYQQHNNNANKLFGYESDTNLKQQLINLNKYYDFYQDDSFLNKCDFIVANQVYEHLDKNERIEFVKRSHALLKNGGMLVLAFPFSLYNMNFKYFWEDITHNPVGVETEAGLINLLGFDTELYVGGLKAEPFSLFENIICLVRNLLLLFPPFWITLIIAKKK